MKETLKKIVLLPALNIVQITKREKNKRDEFGNVIKDTLGNVNKSFFHLIYVKQTDSLRKLYELFEKSVESGDLTNNPLQLATDQFSAVIEEARDKVYVIIVGSDLLRSYFRRTLSLPKDKPVLEEELQMFYTDALISMNVEYVEAGQEYSAGLVYKNSQLRTLGIQFDEMRATEENKLVFQTNKDMCASRIERISYIGQETAKRQLEVAANVRKTNEGYLRVLNGNAFEEPIPTPTDDPKDDPKNDPKVDLVGALGNPPPVKNKK